MSLKLTKYDKYADILHVYYLNILMSFTEKHMEVYFLSLWEPTPLTVTCETQDWALENLCSTAKSYSPVYFETLDSIKAEVQQPSSLVGGKNLEVYSIDSQLSSLQWLEMMDSKPLLHLSPTQQLSQILRAFITIFIQIGHNIKWSLIFWDLLKTQEDIVENTAPEISYSYIYLHRKMLLSILNVLSKDINS